MGRSQEKIKYQISIHPKALANLDKLDFPVRKRVSKKVDWLGENAETIFHHQLSSMPDELKGLCRIHAGDWIILYWVYHNKKEIKIYGIEYRSRVYKKL